MGRRRMKEGNAKFKSKGFVFVPGTQVFPKQHFLAKESDRTFHFNGQSRKQWMTLNLIFEKKHRGFRDSWSDLLPTGIHSCEHSVWKRAGARRPRGEWVYSGTSPALRTSDTPRGPWWVHLPSSPSCPRGSLQGGMCVCLDKDILDLLVKHSHEVSGNSVGYSGYYRSHSTVRVTPQRLSLSRCLTQA